MSLEGVLDTLHQDREIAVQRILDEMLAYLNAVIPALDDTTLVTEGQVLRYLLEHITVRKGP